jgi:hypothetical protein
MLQLSVSETTGQVVVHEPRRLHERIANRRSDELETPLDQVLAHRLGLGAHDRNLSLRFPAVDDGLDQGSSSLTLDRSASEESVNAFVAASRPMVAARSCHGIAAVHRHAHANVRT